MAPFVCVVTGPIVGLDGTQLLRDTAEFAASVGRPLVVFDLFDEILAAADMEAANPFEKLVRVGELMDGYQFQFELQRQNAYQSIARKIDRLPKGTSAIVRAPATVEWRGVNVEFKDHRAIADTIAPDRIVTLIDAEWKIHDRLRTRYGEAASRLIVQEPTLGIPAVLRWLGAEVSRSEDWAEWCRQLTGKPVRHYVLGVQIPGFADRATFHPDVDNLTKAATDPTVPAFYASYSMTVSSEEARTEINRAIRRLRGFGIVVDPASIEIGVAPSEDEGVVFAFTVARDLRWDVRKVDIVAAFHPYPNNPPLSTGMLDELGHARAFRKERYFVLPSGSRSPFTGGTYIPKNHLFTGLDELIEFLEKHRRPVLKARHADQTEAFARWQAWRSAGGDDGRSEKDLAASSVVAKSRP